MFGGFSPLENKLEDALKENRIMRVALREIADERKSYKGHGDYDILPNLSAEEAQAVACNALIEVGW